MLKYMKNISLRLLTTLSAITTLRLLFQWLLPYSLEHSELKVIHIFPNNGIKLVFLLVVKRDLLIIIPYMKWKLHVLPALKTRENVKFALLKRLQLWEARDLLLLASKLIRIIKPKRIQLSSTISISAISDWV